MAPKVAVATGLTANSVRPETPPAARKAQQPKDGVIALEGDLVLKISGKEISSTGLRIYVLFNDYPRSRHSRPMTASESRKVSRFKPRLVAVGTDTVQTTIEIAPDGIYDFRAVSDQGNFEGSCVITIAGMSKTKKVRPLGFRRVGGDATIVKVLMPEGVIWEDASEFDGTIEDSESVTKYNSQTGLVWKGFKR